MSASLSRAQYQSLLRLARRHARVREEAEDLLHDALIAAVAAGRLPWHGGLSWFNGVLRNRAAMDARNAVRRRQRDSVAVRTAEVEDGASSPPWLAIADLPAALKIVALLVLTGHNRAEISHVLRISDETLRQRLALLRRRLRMAGNDEPLAEFAGLGPGLAFGALRQALLPALGNGEAHLGSHDLDGHLFVVNIAPDGSHKKRSHGN